MYPPGHVLSGQRLSVLYTRNVIVIFYLTISLLHFIIYVRRGECSGANVLPSLLTACEMHSFSR